MNDFSRETGEGEWIRNLSTVKNAGDFGKAAREIFELLNRTFPPEKVDATYIVTLIPCFDAILEGAGRFKIFKLTRLAEKSIDLLNGLAVTTGKLDKSLVDLLRRIFEAALQMTREYSENESIKLNVSSLIAEVEIMAEILVGEKEAVILSPSSGGNSSGKPAKLEFDPDMQKVVNDFLLETDELVEELDADLLQWEESGDDPDVINSIFRAFHTIKGNAGALGFSALQKVVHKNEDMIRKIRDGEMPLTSQVSSGVLKATSLVKYLLDDIREGVVTDLELSPYLTELDLILNEDIEELKKFQSENGTVLKIPRRENSKNKTQSTTIRVDVNKLDHLINSAGELILTRNRLLDFSTKLENHEYSGEPYEFLDSYNAELGVLTTELQTMIMKTRMQPVQKVFSKYPRVVKDLAKDLGKDIQLVIEGEETELDNTIIEEISDPLIHLIRNACDHGIEMPADRKKNGKIARGTVVLSAYYEGNNAIIKIKDDGKGMDKTVIAEKGVEKKLISAEQAKKMSKKEILNLIFEAGFSTASKVTNVSGRGVGMDVVRSNIQKLKGEVELDSNPGEGSTVLVKLPLTLAVIRALEVQAGVEKYLIPIEEVYETDLIGPDRLLETLATKRYAYRNTECHLISLSDILDRSGEEADSSQSRYVVLLSNGAGHLGVLVDNIIQQHEVLVKPLGNFLEGFSPPYLSGATIMGDGNVQLILDNKKILENYKEYITQGSSIEV